jgi:hypothetical protein
MRRGTSVETSLAVIALAALVHLQIPQVVKAFVIAKTHGEPFTAPKDANGNPNMGQFAKWAAGFAGLTIILLVMEDSPSFVDFAEVVGITTATAAVIVALPELQPLFTQGAPGGWGSQTTAPAGQQAPAPVYPGQGQHVG